ncbi:MAG: pantetheine-phosphate adenylyltransferase [Myxococcales bacterium]|nr:pantetheine-phosphate adenylyltransferase [Myxococcales bacterium]
MSERIAIYPGSFDPITNGHVGIIERGLQLFDRVVIGVLRNLSKTPMFDVAERKELIRSVFPDEDRIEIESFDGLLVNYARAKGAVAIIRGLRGVTDFEYELQMCNMNRRLAPDVNTVFLMAEERHAYISSSLLKEVAKLGGDITGLVPDLVLQRLTERFDSN